MLSKEAMSAQRHSASQITGAVRGWFHSRTFRALLPLFLMTFLALTGAMPVFAQPETHGGGEANLVLPDLDRFNFKPELAHLQTVAAHDFGRMLLYGALWTGVFLTAAVLLFRRRDFR